MTRPALRRVAPPAPAPIGGLYDPRFIYVKSIDTDLHATFKRIRAQQLKDTK